MLNTRAFLFGYFLSLSAATLMTSAEVEVEPTMPEPTTPIFTPALLP